MLAKRGIELRLDAVEKIAPLQNTIEKVLEIKNSAADPWKQLIRVLTDCNCQGRRSKRWWCLENEWDTKNNIDGCICFGKLEIHIFYVSNPNGWLHRVE